MSTQGITKKTPGPLAPPVRSLPSLKMTALSYSWTTLTTKSIERGSVMMMKKSERTVIASAQRPGPSSQAKQNILFNPIISWILDNCNAVHNHTIEKPM